MRWFSYFILAYLALGVQVGLGDYFSYRGAMPNFVLICVIFIAINAPRDSALLGCFGLGVMHDLLTQQPPGMFALSYGIVGLAISGTHQVVYREHPLTHFSMTLLGGFLVAFVILLHGWIHPPGPAAKMWIGGAGPVPATQVSVAAMRPSASTEFVRVFYTAIFAPIILGVLQRIKKGFAFQPARRKLVNRN